MSKHSGIKSDIPYKELEALCEAYKDGRVVVLPCKVGDTVYFWWNENHLEDVEIKKAIINADGIMFVAISMYNYKFFKPSDIGKTVFFTREEAEAKLKEGDHEHHHNRRPADNEKEQPDKD